MALNVVVGITGGIAAYKAVNVVRSLVLAGHDVHVVATEAALRFVGRPTLEAISRNPVHSELYEGVAEVRHVAIGQAADLIVIAPATANTIAKLAAGIADDLLGNSVLASTAPLVIAPAMHTEMWQNPATVANIATLRSRGVTVVGPAVGQLTGKDSGPGRLEEPETIVAAALAVQAEHAARLAASCDLSGHRIVVTAGGTREPLDPVRFLGNRSSGRQGVAIAAAARARGADVTLIAAHLEVAPPEGVRLVEASTARDLQAAVTDAAEQADILVMAAAVADYRPAVVVDSKIKKETQGDTLELSLVKNPDILAELGAARRAGGFPGLRLIGFAAETEPDAAALLELGRAKIARKGADLLVVNRVGWTEGFATDGNSVVVLNRAGDIVSEAAGSKMSVADRILDAIVALD
ncbi:MULTISPECIES: bifunctional phosphopantothenoylcysteine decarboxylase/phosphopantothenate--cysteine ligase CoaBC [unclassified Leifsonia]|uniref:bifunctional phosphopantothenoylcysteine decarboxylase/phosphopantothenate--cysteine ligase CoaBC n=1 Tax=unclassified Leifsonia TaxID=2663824 RepID=UPI0006FCA023|nr:MULTISPECIES: bifunctional phosphopantothenoylcysteine decarboxylase/phosphopantothenate--cysteine ligase CoaBC [unclassified Leifsonia]KQX06806.1 phosphopantothenoylcysteine decarboxylase [Leifsonia sp. Root1293]KRA11091.1 phosphopantothenoylcysteine decarboxylase [Leifsonia sp. Root60]